MRGGAAHPPRISVTTSPSGTASPPPRVTAIYPSGPSLPENLLRFYVLFSQPMQRGYAREHIALLGPDGQPEDDALYRAPDELWSPNMQCLTVLLDPGRIKRGLGPHRDLGPPLRAGTRYTLVVGAHMTDFTGRPLADAAHKPFIATRPWRRPVSLSDWRLYTPRASTHAGLVLAFPHPMDWAMLAQSPSVETLGGRRIPGRSTAEAHQTLWSFAPLTPWQPGEFIVKASPALEDICGNDLLGPFERTTTPSPADLELHQVPTTFRFRVAKTTFG